MKRIRIAIVRSTSCFSAENPAGIRIVNFMQTFAKNGACVSLWQYGADWDNGAADYVASASDSSISFNLLYVGRIFWRMLQSIDQFLCRLIKSEHISFARNFFFHWHSSRKINVWNPDVILTSLPEVGSLSMASRIARKCGARLVVDFRDTPDEFDPKHEKIQTKRTVKWIGRFIRSADLVVTVSQPLSVSLCKNFALTEVPVILNGYEGDLEIQARVTQKHGDGFQLFYGGSLAYGRDKSLHILLSAVDLLLKNGIQCDKICLVIAGAGDVNHDDFKMHEAYSCVQWLGRLPRERVLVMQKESDVLISIASPQVAGVLTSKIFEYIKAFRPILNIPRDNGVLDDFIHCGKVGISLSKAEDVARWLDVMMQLTQRNGYCPINYDIKYLEQFSRNRQGEILYKQICGICY